MDSKSILVILVLLVVVDLTKTVIGSGCVNIFEQARVSCGASTTNECQNKGCCWDEETVNDDLKCYQPDCRPGYFGWGCRFQCNCKEGRPCDVTSGECPTGCPGDRWGRGCLLDNSCTYNDLESEHYIGHRSRTEHGHTCFDWTDQRAYPGEQFPDGSQEAAKNYCRNPKPLDHKTWCYYWVGAPHGKKDWDYCDLHQCDCPLGRYGVNCDEECHCKDPADVCNPLSGSCPSGCHRHWTGPGCQACGAQYFGELCSGVCHCANESESCDKITGSCQTGCARGWNGHDCQTECVDGRYGYDCRSSCNCLDLDEICDKVSGRCQSGCRDGYAGDSCQIEVPVMTRPPRVSDRDVTSVTITWLPWQNPPDHGDGPVTGYYLYYRLLGYDDWKKLQVDNRSHQLNDLESNSIYQFKVLAIHQAGYYAVASPILNASTCTRPLAGPTDISIRASEQRSRNTVDNSGTSELIVAWRLPRSPDLWGCESIMKYKVYYKKTGAEIYENIMEVVTQYATLTEIDQFSNYSIAISLVNNAALESDLTTEYYIGKSGPVHDLVAMPMSTSLTVSWAAPGHSNGAILYYVVRYRQQQIGSCLAEHMSWTPKVDVDPDETSYLIQALSPYSVYGIRVWAHTAAGKGQFTTISVTTQAAVPSAAPVDLEQVALSSTYAKFTWQPPGCDRRHGEYIGFRYVLTDQSKQQVVRQEVINRTEVELLGLVPYTEYSVQVNFVNHAFEGPKTTPHVFKTDEDTPPSPRNVFLEVTGSQTVRVTWDAPSPPHGVILKYVVQYRILHGLIEPVNRTVDACTSCNATLSGLRPHARYGVKIQAYTGKGAGPWSVATNVTTEEDIPSEPATFINMSRSTSSITFRWITPLKKNGELLNYKILCSPSSPLGQYLKDLEKEMPSETLEYQVGGLRPGTGYQCSLSASTSVGYGPSITKIFYTEPQAPSAPYVPELQPSQSTDTTVTIRVQPSHTSAYATDSVYRIVVENLVSDTKGSRIRRDSEHLPCGLQNTELLQYQLALQSGQLCYVAAEINYNRVKTREFVIGDNQTYGLYYNAPLVKGGQYGIWYGVVVTVDGVSQSAYTKLNEPVIAEFVKPVGEKSMAVAGAAIGAAIAIVLLIVVIVILVIRKKKKGLHKMEERSQITDTDRVEGSSGAVIGDVPELDVTFRPALCATTVVEEEVSGEISETSPLCEITPPETQYSPIVVEKLWAYVQEQKANKGQGLRKEYEQIALGLQHPCEVARRPENKFKNRYGNIIAYDHSRVILECTDDPTSDYINANYVAGYRKPNAFIAAQGPSKYTLGDMWRMTWQQNSRRIVMVTNLVEDGRSSRHLRSVVTPGSVEHKCEQYWPDGEQRHYDDIVVDLVDTEHFADFVIRTFTMTKDNVTKTVNQLHFTAWPDHGVPNYATSLLAFRRKVRALDDPTAGPTVVHCSAGVGRTGTFVAIDYLLDQAKVEGQVDIYHCVHAMRANRVNMVQTQEQYNFVYDALLEALKSGDTSISCAVFRRKYRHLQEVNPDTGRVRMVEEFELLNTMRPPSDTVCKDAHSPENIDKNRFKNIVPIDNLSRAYLLNYTPGSNDYINAVFVDGYKQRDAFIITQMTLPKTIADFWAMIYDQDCRTVIMMNNLDLLDSTCACYYPEDVGSKNYGPFAIETISIDTTVDDVTVRDFSITYIKRGSNDTRFIRQFQYNGWLEETAVPTSRSSLIALLGLVEKWQQRSGNKTIVTHCMDGATKSGLFCAVSYMVERLKVEQEVDVFQSVKQMRINRPQIVPTMEQYQFAYDMAVEYMDCFETYSNFK